jgi:uncharacterized protein
LVAVEAETVEPEDKGLIGPPSPFQPTRRQILKGIAFGAAAGMLGGGLAEFYSFEIEVVSRELRLPRWDADGFRVAVISDIHANNAIAAARTSKAVELALTQKPDLIVIPGDFVNWGTPAVIGTMVRSLEGLHEARCPVLGAMGNHDYWSKAPGDILEALRQKTAVNMLVNSALEVGGVTVVGLDDALSGRYRPEVVADCHSRSLLVMLHEPDAVENTPSNASLQISGHSHGGQICLPGGLPLRLPRGAHRYFEGFYESAKVPLYVSRGVGTVGPGFRTFCAPEVSVLTLRSAI